jgi:hypothetical protein
MLSKKNFPKVTSSWFNFSTSKMMHGPINIRFIICSIFLHFLWPAHSSYTVCDLCDSMLCSLVNIFSIFEENDCSVSRKKMKFSKGWTSIWELYKRALFQVPCNESNNSFRNTDIYQHPSFNFPEVNNHCGCFLITSSEPYASFRTPFFFVVCIWLLLF